MPVYKVQAPNGKIYDVEGPENADENKLFAVVQQQVKSEELEKMRRESAGFLETFGSAAARGAGQLASTFTDIIPAAVGSALGFEDYAKEQLKEAEEKRVAREAKYPTLFRSYKEIEGIGDFAKYATETVGEQLANIATSFVPGVGAGVLAGRSAATGLAKGFATQAAERGLAGEAAEQAIAAGLRGASPEIAKATLRGQVAGAYLGSYALNAPEVFENIYEETKELAPGAAALFGSVSAALDAILPAQLARQIAGPTKAAIVGKVLEKSGMEKGLARSITMGVLKGTAGEGLTEGAQEAISIAAERFVNDNPGVFGSKEWDRIVESAVKGAVAGGAFGGVGGGVKGLRDRAAAKRQEAEQARIRGEEQLAQQREAEAAQLEQAAQAASTEIEALQRPTTEAEQEAYGVEKQAGPFSPVMPYGPITPKEYRKQEAQLNKDRKELAKLLEELAPEKLDLVGLAERPPAIEQTLQKAGEPLERLQERGMRKGELNLEEMRRVGWNEEWNTLVPNIAELAQPEFRKALTSDVTIPVKTRQGIIESGKQLTLPDGKPIIPKTARYSYPDASSTKIDDLRKISKDVFGVAPNAKIISKPPELGGIAGLDFSDPAQATVVRQKLDEFANSDKAPLGAADKIEKFLQLPQFKALEGAPSATGIDEQAGREGAGVSGKRARRTAPASVESTERGRVDALTGDARQPVVGETAQPGALETQTAQPQTVPAPAAPQLTPEQEAARAEAEFLGEEQVPIEERGAMLRRPGRREFTPEEARAVEKEATEIIEAEAPVKPIENKTIRKLVNEFFGEHYLDPDKKLYLPKYQGPAFDKIQARFAEAGDLNGLLRNLLDSNPDPAIKQVLRRIRSLNLKTKLEIGDPSTGVYFNQFYSALFRAVSQIPNKSATPEEWRGIIRGLVSKGTVKADEVFWTGLDDWLTSKKDVTNKLEKKELIDYLNSHGLFIDVNELSGDQTKYDGYDTPGGLNYREILPYLPEVPVIASNTVLRKEPDEKSEVLEKLPEGMFLLFDQEDSYLNNVQQFRLGKEAGVEWVKIIPLKETDKRDETGLEEGQPGWVRASDIRIHQELKFLTRHWPGLINPLGHIRINTRYDAEGNKILFVEEIQSDWAQQAKKTGFVSKEKFDATKEEIKKLVEEEAKLNVEIGDSFKETGRLRAELEKEARKKSQTFYKYMTDKYGEGNPILAMQIILHPQVNPNWLSVSAALRNAAQGVPMYLTGNKHSVLYKNSTRYRDMFDVLTKIAEISPRNWEGLSDSQKEALHFDVFTVLKRAMEEIPPAKEKSPADATTVYSRQRTGALAARTLADKFFADFFLEAFYEELGVGQVGLLYERDKTSGFLPEEITSLQNKIRDNERNEAIIDDELISIRYKIKERKKEQQRLTLAGPYIGIPKRAVIVPITEEVTEIDARTGKPKPRTKEVGYRVNYGKDYYTFTSRKDAEAQAAALDSRKEAAPSSEGWMNLALKQIALMAVKEGYDKVAFIDWNRSHERFPLDREGNPTANLFSTLYGDTTGNQVNSDKPSLLKQGLQKLLNNWKGNPTLVRPNIGLSLRKGESRELTPNNAEVFVGKVLVEPYIGYGNQDRYDVEGRPEIIFRKGHKLTLKDVNDIREHIVRGEQLSASLVVESDGFFDALGFDVTPAMQDKISQGLPYMYGKSGSYDPRSDTIILDPELGMNAHTFIHEVVHAAISNVLRNTNHPLTKEFEKFFVSIKDRLGSAYGGTDLQEFAAELVSNPSFQALLKSIKTPRSESLFMSVLRKIAEFFGFAKDTTAFTQGLKFIDAALDLTGGMEAVPGEKLFFGMGDFSPIDTVQKAMPAPVGRALDGVRNTLSNLAGSSLLEEALGALRLDNLRDLYKKQLPSIDLLQDALEKRVAREEKDIRRVNDNYTKFVKIQQKHPEQMKEMSNISIEASQAEVDITKKFERKPIDPAKLAGMSKTQRDVYESIEEKRERDHKRLRDRYLKLDPEVRGVYETIRNDYDNAFKQYRKILEDAAEGVPGLAQQLREQFETAHPLIGYVPFLRYGDYWLEFTSPDTGFPAVMAFESIRERNQFIEKNLKGKDYREFQRFENIEYSADRIPPTHFISKVIKGLQAKGASREQVNSVYQAYLAAFPAESIAKQFMKRRGIEGMEKDLIRNYSDLMVRWTRKLNNSEFLPQIDRALSQIEQEATDQPPEIAAAAKSILRQKAFFHNPTYGKWVSAGTALSYYEFMAGNISSGIINLTSLPLMVFPLLSGRFNPITASGALLSAIQEGLPSNDWSKTPKYKKLYETLMDHGQLEHTMAREVLEGRRQRTEDYTGTKAKIVELVSLPFSISEKWNRASTAIAAFNLEYARTKNEDAAIKYALDTVRTAHTSGMAVTGSRWLQTPVGRLFGTFKSIIWQQAYVIARAFYQAAKGADPETRKAARHQLLAMYGMATVFVGVKGMPFYGAMSVLAEMLNAMFGDDDEPFDFDEFMRDLLPMFLYKGLANYFLNLEIANRAGLANDIIFRDDPYGVAKHGYVFSALQQAFGPIGSVAVNAERSVELFKDGEIMRSIEASVPSALRNVLKTVRYMNDGVTTLKGEPIMEDINAYNLTMQLVGFAPADLSNRYEMLQAAKGFERKILERRQDALRMADMAITSGDMDMFQDAMDRIQRFNEANPQFQITADSLRRSQRARKAAEKDMIYGIRFNKNLLPEIRKEFFENEE